MSAYRYAQCMRQPCANHAPRSSTRKFWSPASLLPIGCSHWIPFLVLAAVRRNSGARSYGGTKRSRAKQCKAELSTKRIKGTHNEAEQRLRKLREPCWLGFPRSPLSPANRHCCAAAAAGDIRHRRRCWLPQLLEAYETAAAGNIHYQRSCENCESVAHFLTQMWRGPLKQLLLDTFEHHSRTSVCVCNTFLYKFITFHSFSIPFCRFQCNCFLFNHFVRFPICFVFRNTFASIFHTFVYFFITFVCIPNIFQYFGLQCPTLE